MDKRVTGSFYDIWVDGSANSGAGQHKKQIGLGFVTRNALTRDQEETSISLRQISGSSLVAEFMAVAEAIDSVPEKTNVRLRLIMDCLAVYNFLYTGSRPEVGKHNEPLLDAAIEAIDRRAKDSTILIPNKVARQADPNMILAGNLAATGADDYGTTVETIQPKTKPVDDLSQFFDHVPPELERATMHRPGEIWVAARVSRRKSGHQEKIGLGIVIREANGTIKKISSHFQPKKRVNPVAAEFMAVSESLKHISNGRYSLHTSEDAVFEYLMRGTRPERGTSRRSSIESAINTLENGTRNMLILKPLKGKDRLSANMRRAHELANGAAREDIGAQTTLRRENGYAEAMPESTKPSTGRSGHSRYHPDVQPTAPEWSPV